LDPRTVVGDDRCEQFNRSKLIPFFPLNTYSDLSYFPLLFAGVMGTCIGSFINVVVDRGTHDESLSGRSHCDFCKKKLQIRDLIPLFSYLFLKGKCRYCHKKLSFQYPLVEFLTGVWFVLVVLLSASADLVHIVLYWGIVSSAWIIFLSDLKYQLISDSVQLSLFIFIVLLKLVERATLFSLGFDVVSGLLVALPIGLIYFISKERAMGLGDVILAFLIGFLFGTVKGFLTLYFGFILGAIVGIVLIISQKKKMRSTISFGPFLILGMVGAALWGDILIQVLKKIYKI